MFAISINNRTADERLRGALTVADGQLDYMLGRISDRNHDAVVICTCNRTEIYGELGTEKAINALSAVSGVDPSIIREHCLVFTGEAAIGHLFNVAAGLDSMVIGEDQILGQVKDAAKRARAAGCYGNSFPQIFQAAFAAAKKVKTDTLLSKTSVSIATLAASCCHRFSDHKKKILMIGAGGDIGSSLRKDLLSYGDCQITATVHRNRFSDRGIRLIDYHDRYQGIEDYDIIISATKSPHYTVIRTRLPDQMTDKSRLFIDLSVPSDIDPAVSGIKGARLVTIDDFRQLARENNDRKATAVEKAEMIIKEEKEALLKEISIKQIIPDLDKYSNRYGQGFRKFLFDYKKKADADDFAKFISTALSMIEH
ncbi:glutamyl-tRNA reductase [Candidatus Weimeria sp. HCP3S3_B5]|uniref:glutamyl-tRNA reductase n=1 Tax=Candidatus Weimeria sp. HCP3S3_B5 TaxID=3438871 RepID=UPI003F8B88E3